MDSIPRPLTISPPPLNVKSRTPTLNQQKNVLPAVLRKPIALRAQAIAVPIALIKILGQFLPQPILPGIFRVVSLLQENSLKEPIMEVTVRIKKGIKPYGGKIFPAVKIAGGYAVNVAIKTNPKYHALNRHPFSRDIREYRENEVIEL